MVTAGSWEPSSAPRHTRARGPGSVHDGLAPVPAACSTQAENHWPRCVPGTPPSDVDAHRAKNCPPARKVVSRTAHLLAGLRGRTRAV